MSQRYIARNSKAYLVQYRQLALIWCSGFLRSLLDCDCCKACCETVKLFKACHDNCALAFDLCKIIIWICYQLRSFAIKSYISFSRRFIRLRRRWSHSGSEFNFCIPLCWDRIDWILLVSWQRGNTNQLAGGRVLLLSRTKYQVAVWLECLRYFFILG